MTAALDAKGGRLAVRRWRSHCVVSCEQPLPQRVRDRVDDTLRAQLPSVLASRLAPLCRDDPGTLVFVRRLAFDVAIDVAWDGAAIAERCARALADSLSRELTAGDSDNVARFRDTVDYLASYLAERAAGDASSRWYYEAFAGLSALPAAAALRTALAARPGEGAAALRRLEARQLSQVLATLGAREAAHVCEAFRRALPAGDAAEALAELVALERREAPAFEAAAQRALRLLAQAQAPPSTAMVAAAQWLGSLHEALAIGGFTAEQLAVAVDGLPAPLASCEASVRAAWEAVPRSARQAWLERAVDPARASAPPSPHAHTPFGGAFLLLDDLAAIPWADATRGWPDACGTRAEVALPFLVLATCFGADRAPLLFADGSWRALFGVDPTLDLPAARAWLDTLGGERRRGLERMLARDPAGRRADAWHRVELAGSAWRVRIDEGGTWRACTRACGATASAECDDTQAQAVADDLDYLLGAATGRSAWPRTIAVAAQRVVHAFLQRIPGFARTHLRHARRNFLEAAATVEPEDARIVVRLARPPLALMLNLAGLNRGQRRWPALDTRPFAIFTES